MEWKASLCFYDGLLTHADLVIWCLVLAVQIDFIYNTHGHRITRWNNLLLNPPALEMYARLIHGKGAALHNCFGFVDGTVRPIARPDQHQRVMYNGHKRVHAIKFQSVVLPNGLIANLYGPVGNYVFQVAVFNATIM